MKHIVALILALALSGCLTTSPQTVSKGVTPKANEGVVIVNFQCDKPIELAHIYRSGTQLSTFTMPVFENQATLHCNQGYQTMIMAEGTYFISSVYSGPLVGKPVKMSYLPEEKSLRFTVKRGKTNYIGDIRFAFNTMKRIENPKSRDLELVSMIGNDLTRAHVFMKASQPDLLAKYPIVAAPARL